MLTLQENEIIIATFRKHWILPAVHTIAMSVLFVIPILILLFIAGRTITTEFFEITFRVEEPAVAVFLISMWGLFLWLRFFSFWTDHHLDGWVLTNKRVIDMEQRGFFQRDIASFRLERLQDVTTEVRGIIATFFKYGDVHVQTAGTDREFVLRVAANPNAVKEKILGEHDRTIDSDMYRDKDSVASPR